MTFYAACIGQTGPLGLHSNPELSLALRERAARLGFSTSLPPNPEALATGWKRFLDSSTAIQGRETPDDVCVLAAFENLTARQSHTLHNAFFALGLKLGPSRTEMQLRAASRLFMLGRKGTFDADDIGDHQVILQSSIRYFDAAAEKANFLPDTKLQRLYGMRGVAQLLLSRVSSVSESNLRRSLEDLKTAHARGEVSEQNLVYRREAALRLCEFKRDPRVLSELEFWLGQSCKRDRQYFCDQALYYQHAATVAAESGENPSELLTLGILACDTGLMAPDDHRTPDAVFQNHRGFLRFIRRKPVEDGKSLDIADLDLALSDLRAAHFHGLGGASLALALLRRARAAQASKSHDAALEYVNEGLSALTLISNSDVAERVRLQLGAATLASRLASAVEASDPASVRAVSSLLLALGPVALFHCSTLIYGMRFLIKAGVAVPALAEDRRLAEAILELNEEGLEGDEEGNGGEEYASYRDYLGGVSRWLDGDIVSRRTFGYFRASLAQPGPHSADLYAQAADVALQLGKRRSREGYGNEAAQLFEESTAWYERALSTHISIPSNSSAGFLPMTCHSKAGEAYLRLRAGRLGAGSITDAAIAHLTRSRELGNNSPELLGLLGDAYYRRGQFTGDKASLVQALELKTQARTLGHSSRESWSVAARINYRLSELTGDVSYIADAIDCALSAHASSPGWPWPLFQLAEFSVLPPNALSAALAVSAHDKDIAAARMLAAGNRSGLLGAAAELAASNTEFATLVLGGRTKVFVLEDPHRLLSTTIVLKPTSLVDGRREAETTAKFARHLLGSSLRHRFSVPTPVAVLPRGNAAIYVMERARATPLGELIIDARSAGSLKATECVVDALDFLACFHRWAGVRPAPSNWKAQYIRSLRTYTSTLGLSQQQIDEAASLFQTLLPPDLQHVQKKDAHPENWLIAANGSVVMLDLEAASSVPALLDVAQLFEDYPAFDATADGWCMRIDLAVRHHEAAFGLKPEGAEVARAYLPFLILRCAFGLSRSASKGTTVRTSAAVNALDMRVEHYWKTLEFVALNEQGSAAGRLSEILSSAR